MIVLVGQVSKPSPEVPVLSTFKLVKAVVDRRDANISLQDKFLTILIAILPL